MRRAASLTAIWVAAGCGRSALPDPVSEPCRTGVPSPSHIYRSVGPHNTTALASGVGNALTIDGDTARFATPLPRAVGVGDVLEYDADDDAVADTLASLVRRLGPSAFVVRPVSGEGRPRPVTACVRWSLFRAYTSLADAIAGNENPGIAPHLADFDAWPAIHDLTTVGQTWHLACYGDGVDDRAVDLRSWTTGPESYVRLFTPVDACEVGSSQRHHGAWSASAYRLVVTFSSCCRSVVAVTTDYARVEGLQVHLVSSTSWTHGIEVTTPSGSATSEAQISHNIVRATLTGETHVTNGIHLPQGGAVDNGEFVKIWNNVVYDFVNGDKVATGIDLGNDADHRVHAHNNTVYNCWQGLSCHYATIENVLKNNLVQASATVDYDIYGDAADDTAANISGDDTSPDIGFGAAVVVFRDAAGGDLRLSDADIAAVDRGVDLRADEVLPFATDIEGDSRPRGTAWDVGADER